MARLGDICTIVSGSTPKSNVPEYWDGSIKWITPAELDQGTYIINDSVRHITELGVAKTGLKPFPQGTVILSSRAPIGKTAIAGCEMYCNQGFKNLICSDRINPRYLYWFLTCNTEYLNSLGRGATFKEISKEIVANIEIPLPAMEQQISVAEKFEKISELLALRKEQLTKLDQLVKSRFIELFGDPDTNPMHWQEAPLGDHLAVIGGYAFKSDGFLESGIPVLRIGNINSGHFLPVNMVYWQEDISLQRYKMYPGDLVMSLTGTVGKDDYGNVCILDDDYDEYYLNQRNAKLDIAQTLNKHYLSEMLRFSSIKKRLTGISRGVRQANISNKDILSLVVPIPPVDLQDQFADFVEQTDKSKMAIQQSLDKLELLKKSLMQEYFG